MYSFHVWTYSSENLSDAKIVLLADEGEAEAKDWVLREVGVVLDVNVFQRIMRVDDDDWSAGDAQTSHDGHLLVWMSVCNIVANCVNCRLVWVVT